jgi:hypothetical protein
MKWNVDKALTELAKWASDRDTLAGISQVYVDASRATEVGVHPTPPETQRGVCFVWKVYLLAGMNIHSFYGRTIQEAYHKARRMLRPPVGKSTKKKVDRFKRRRVGHEQ